MNVLIFVVTMLMVLSIMTYARIESFRNTSALKSQFEWYMKTQERSYGNSIAKKKYTDQHPTSRKKTTKDPDSNQEKQDKANSRLSFHLFVTRSQRSLKQDRFNQLYEIAKLLMTELYGHAEFFQEAVEKHPQLLDQLLERLMLAAENLPKGQKIESPADLASIDLEDIELNEIFYRMLKGTTEIEKQRKEQIYPSLLNYITLDQKSRIRIYLASKELLTVIYGDPTLVDEIIKERYSLYKQLDKKEITKKEASETFKNLFQGKERSLIDEKILSFKVSKTDPKTYQ